LTIIFEVGNTFWIEAHEGVINLTNAAGIYGTGAIALDRAGTFLGATMQVNNIGVTDQTQALAAVSFRRRNPNGDLSIGTEFQEFEGRYTKQIGTAGATVLNVTILLFMRGTGR